MQANARATGVLSEVFGPATGAAAWGKRIALFVLGIVSLWVSAKIQVATIPVPITMQVFVVLTIGAAFGARLGFATVLGYLALGAMGEPVFAGTPQAGLGIPYMQGLTGGYLFGFALAAGVVGWLAERGWDRSMFTMAGAMLIGLVLVHLPGAAWIAYWSGADKAWALGVHPFLWIDLAKAALAVLLFPTIWRLLGR